jgi:hypothetical protein
MGRMAIELRALRATSRWQRAVGAIGLVVLVWVGSDLERIIGSGTPDGSPGQSPPAEGHDPSQFQHGG